MSTASITSEELLLLDDFFSERLGIHLADHRREMLLSRLTERVEALHMRTFMDYYILLQFHLTGELPHLTRILTNNETYFFRETYQFDALFGPGLEALRAQPRDGWKSPRRLSELALLCAGCSSGEEAYTLRAHARDNLHRLWGTDVRIDAFDINRERLAVAELAEYGRSSLRNVTDEQRLTYFEELGPERYRVRPQYRQGVRFAYGNIMDAASYARGAPYDALFCRNVLIYFSEPALRRAVANFARVIRPGGFLFLGHSESIIGMSTDFEVLRLGECIAYRRSGA